MKLLEFNTREVIKMSRNDILGVFDASRDDGVVSIIAGYRHLKRSDCMTLNNVIGVDRNLWAVNKLDVRTINLRCKLSKSHFVKVAIIALFLNKHHEFKAFNITSINAIFKSCNRKAF